MNDRGSRGTKAGGARAPGGPPRHDDEHRRMAELLGTLREDFHAPADLRAAVMSRVHDTPEPLWRRVADWLLRPRTVRVSPAMGGLAVAALAVLVLVTSSLLSPVGENPEAGAGGAVTRFVLIAPEASSVQLTGDFVDWSPRGIALRDQRGTGVWTVDVPLQPGVYQYAFIVNGEEWRPDPRAVSTVDDGFGRENSVVIVSGASEL